MYIDLIIKINDLIITCTVYLEYEVPIMICIAISIAEALYLDIRCYGGPEGHS